MEIELVYPAEGQITVEELHSLLHEDDLVMWHGEEYYARFLQDDNVIQFATRDDFERWSNSVRYIYHGLPNDAEHLRQIINNFCSLIDI